MSFKNMTRSQGHDPVTGACYEFVLSID